MGDLKTASSLSVVSATLILLLALVSFSFVPVAHADGGLVKCTTGELLGANETPPNASPATGSVDIIVDTSSNIVLFTLTFSGLVAPSTAAHIHLGPAGVAGPVKVPLPLDGASGVTSGTVSGTGTPIGGFNVADIVSNPTGFYVNVHSSVFPGGEIRGQLINCTEEQQSVPEFPLALTSLVLVVVLLPVIIALRRRASLSP